MSSVELSMQQISDMKHALGLKKGTVGPFYASRNFFGVSKKIEHLDELVSLEYMECNYKEMVSEYVYKVSTKGERLLSKITGVYIIIE